MTIYIYIYIYIYKFENIYENKTVIFKMNNMTELVLKTCFFKLLRTSNIAWLFGLFYGISTFVG